MNEHFLALCADSFAYRDVTSTDDFIVNDDGSSIRVIDGIVDPSPSIEDAIQEAQLTEAVKRFVLSLSPQLRCIVLRHFWFGESQSDIASSIGTSRSAVCHALRRVYKLGFRELSPLA